MRRYRLLILAFPRAWRERYGAELLALIDALPDRRRQAFDLLRAGLRERWRARPYWNRSVVVLAAVTLVIIAPGGVLVVHFDHTLPAGAWRARLGLAAGYGVLGLVLPMVVLSTLERGFGPMISLRTLRARLAENRLLAGAVATFVLILALFCIGLAIVAPHSPGRQVGFSDATTLVQTKGAVAQASFRDQDARLELRMVSGTQVWTPYPRSGALIADILTELETNRVPTRINPQSDLRTLRHVVHDVLPILILATLFATFVLLTLTARGRPLTVKTHTPSAP